MGQTLAIAEKRRVYVVAVEDRLAATQQPLAIADTKKRLHEMDGLRGIAMLFVFLGHFGSMWQASIFPSGASALFLRLIDADATLGSSLFMLLSGFFAYGSLKRSSRSFGAFLQGRLSRLYPMYLIMTVIYVVGSLLSPRMSKLPPNPAGAAIFIVETLLFLPGLLHIRPLMDVAWTLSFVLLFYFIEAAAAHVFGLLRLSRVWRVSALAVACLLWAIGGDANGWWESRTAIFWVGMALLEAIEGMSSVQRAGTTRFLLIPSALIVLGVGLRTSLMLRLPDTGIVSLPVCILVITSITLSALVWVARFGPEWWKRLLASPALGQLGAASYSFYLTHGFTVKAFRFGIIPWLGPAAKLPIVFWTSNVLGLAMSVTIARAVWVLVENPLSEYLKKPARFWRVDRRGQATPA